MIENGVGVVEREALAAARAAHTTAHQAYYRRLEHVARLRRLGVADQTGDRSVERLLQHLWRVDPATTGRWVAEADDLAPRHTLHGQPLPPRLPDTAKVLAAGEVSPEHVTVIRRTMSKIDTLEGVEPGQWSWAESYLADKATLFPPRTLARLADEVLARLDPDGAAPDPDADLCDEVKLTSHRDGSLKMLVTIHDAVDAQMLREGIGVLAAPTGTDDHRSLNHRQACALKEVFADALGPHGLVTDTRHTDTGVDPATDADTDAGTDTGADADTDTGAGAGAAADAGGRQDTDAGADTDADADADDGDGTGDADAGADAGTGEPDCDDTAREDALIPEPRRPEPDRPAAPSAPAPARAALRGPARPLLTITIDYRWLQLAIGHGTLDTGALSDPHTIRRWACDADILPLVLGAKSEPLDIGRRSRLIPDALRRALNHRDRGCAFPGCNRRPRRCHAHHIHAWADHGQTALHNLTLLCVYHHHVIHHGHWTIQMIDGLPWFTPPDWIDPQRRPRPGGRTATLHDTS